MTRAIELLKNSFGVSQLYQHDVVKDGTIIFSVFWHPLTIAERESITKKSDANDPNDFALALMITKALDKNGDRLFKMAIKHLLEEKLKQIFCKKYN